MSERKYELVWILAGNAPQEAIDKSIESVDALVKNNAGKMDKAYYWEQRTLAYPIKGQEIGNYCVAKFKMDGSSVIDFEQALSKDSGVIRHLITKQD